MSMTFDRKTILGEGAFGTVFEGVFKNQKVAIKRVGLRDTNIIREEFSLFGLDHPNVVKLFHFENDDDFRYYAYELCDASLDKLFLKDEDPRKYRGPMPSVEDVLYQLALGLEYIHKMRLIHRDIKPQNVLIKVNATNEVSMKWAGFGTSKPVNQRGTCSMSGVRGTYNFFAPEILKMLEEFGNTNSERRTYSVKSDVFAEALVFGYFLSGGLHLFGSIYNIESNIIKNNPVNLSKIEQQSARDLITKMLEPNPELRLSSSDVVQQLKLIRGKEYTPEQSSLNQNLAQQKTELKKLEVDYNNNLGWGGYGQVFQGVWGDTQVAVKKILSDKVNKLEEEALKKLIHPYIVELCHAESDDNYSYYVFELCQSSLDKLFLKDVDPQKYRGPIPPEINVLIQLSTGLEFIHEMGYVHLDIKPHNILIWVDSTGKQVLMKWADFGLCKPVNERKSYTMSKAKGTVGWYAPETLKYIEEHENSYADNEESPRGNVKSDVFSEGLVFGYFLLGGEHLFGIRFERELNIVKNNPVNLKDIKWPYRALIGQMLEPDPEKRISSADVTQKLKNEIEG